MSDGSLRKVGAMWKPKPGGKSKGTGMVTIGDQRQRFVILVNNHKEEGSKQPDYVLMSSEDPEPDEYGGRKGRSERADNRTSEDDDSVPF